MTDPQSKYPGRSSTADLEPVIRSKNLFAPVTWLLGIAAVTIALSPNLPELLQFDAVAIAGGECWRFLTGHLVHWNLDHMFWDLSVFVVLGTMCERRNRKAYLACVLASAAAISFYVLFALPEMPIYRGLSGIDTGLFALLGVGLFADARARGNGTMPWLIAAAMLGLIAKTAFEFTTDGTVFVDHTAAAFVPVTMAHVLGALVGFAVGLAPVAWRGLRSHVDRSEAFCREPDLLNDRSQLSSTRCAETRGASVQFNVSPNDQTPMTNRESGTTCVPKRIGHSDLRFTFGTDSRTPIGRSVACPIIAIGHLDLSHCDARCPRVIQRDDGVRHKTVAGSAMRARGQPTRL